jgi:hypothetical protein
MGLLTALRRSLGACLGQRAATVQADVIAPDGALVALAHRAEATLEAAVEELLHSGVIMSEAALVAKYVARV